MDRFLELLEVVVELLSESLRAVDIVLKLACLQQPFSVNSCDSIIQWLKRIDLIIYTELTFISRSLKLLSCGTLSIYDS